jgi:cell division protein FtsB
MMAQLVKLRLLFGSALWPAVAILLLLLFVAYAIFGPSGILAWGDYSRQLHVRQAELAQLKKKEAALGNRVKLLDPNHVDPDLADQLVRERLGVTHPDEVVLMQK